MSIRCGTSVARIGGMLLAIWLMVSLPTPVTGGVVACSLTGFFAGSVPEVPVGQEVFIQGFGFPPGEVNVEYSIDGTAIGTETVTADATGFFEVTVTPQPGEEGLWTVTATDIGNVCTEDASFPVTGVAATPTPMPTPTLTPAPSQGLLPNVAVPTPGLRSVPLTLGTALMLLLAALTVLRGVRAGNR